MAAFFSAVEKGTGPEKWPKLVFCPEALGWESNQLEKQKSQSHCTHTSGFRIHTVNLMWEPPSPEIIKIVSGQ